MLEISLFEPQVQQVMMKRNLDSDLSPTHSGSTSIRGCGGGKFVLDSSSDSYAAVKVSGVTGKAARALGEILRVRKLVIPLLSSRLGPSAAPENLCCRGRSRNKHTTCNHDSVLRLRALLGRYLAIP